MAWDIQRHPVECHATRCVYNSNRTCNYSGRIKLDSNGKCDTKQTRGGGVRFEDADLRFQEAEDGLEVSFETPDDATDE